MIFQFCVSNIYFFSLKTAIFSKICPSSKKALVGSNFLGQARGGHGEEKLPQGTTGMTILIRGGHLCAMLYCPKSKLKPFDPLPLGISQKPLIKYQLLIILPHLLITIN